MEWTLYLGIKNSICNFLFITLLVAGQDYKILK